MADRQIFCTCIMSCLILISAGYLAYYLFLHPEHQFINKYTHIRLCIFLSQHLIVIAMMFCLLKNIDQHEDAVKWVFQLSALVMITFVAGEVFLVIKGDKVFGARMVQGAAGHQDIAEFEVNQITLYFQIMTDFALFFIVSTIGMVVLRCRHIDSEQRYEFIIQNLKSEQFVDQLNTPEKKGCPICLTDLETQRVLKLPCDHVFHKECLINWLKRSTICPMCRNDIEQSLSPTSPQIYPPARSQPLHLPPPSPVPDQALNNPIIQPRRVISLNHRNRAQEHLNQNQRQNRYMIVEHAQRMNGMRKNQGLSRYGLRLPMGGQEREVQRQRENDWQQGRKMMRTERQECNDRNKLPNSGAVTQRQKQTYLEGINFRDTSSPPIIQAQVPKTQILQNHQCIPPSLILSKNSSSPQNKCSYQNQKQLEEQYQKMYKNGQNYSIILQKVGE